MNWSSWSDFVAMGGYGLYVWGSFAMCALVMGMEIALLAMRRRSALHGEQEDAVADSAGAGA